MLLLVVLIQRITRVEVRPALLALEVPVVCHANLLMVGADDAAPTGRGHSPSIIGERVAGPVPTNDFPTRSTVER